MEDRGRHLQFEPAARGLALLSEEAPLLTEERREVLDHLGHPSAPELVEALENPIRRGHHLAVLAGEGSGKEALYGIVAGERCDAEIPELQALCLCPTSEATLRTARAIYALNEGLETLAWTPAARRRLAEGDRPAAHVLSGRPEDLLADVRSGRLSLSALRLLIVDGFDALEETGGREPTEALLDTAREGVLKVVVSAALDDRFLKLVEQGLPRARRWPGELFPAGAPGPEPEPGPVPLWYATGATEEERAAALAGALRELADEGRAAVLCPDADAAHRVAASLAAAGLRIAAEPEAPGVEVAWGSDIPPPAGVAVLYGLPAGLDALRRWLEPAASRVVVLPTPHLAQLGLLARRAGWRIRPLSPPAPDAAEEDIDRFRHRVRSEAGAQPPGSELLLLAPLLEELGTAPVLAALARLLRRSPPPRREAADAEGPGERREAPTLPPPAARGAWTRVYLNIGKRDGAGPGDVVGAITGETGAAGAQVGKIDIRPTYTLVDIDSQIVEEVLRGLRGARIKGRDVVARPDRGR